MKYLHQSKAARLVFSAMLCLMTLAGGNARAEENAANAALVASLNGNWQATLIGNGGCGIGTFVINFTLTNGSGPATLISHSQGTNPGCGDVTVTGQTFTIKSLNANGSGTAGVGCGPDCGFNLSIQVTLANLAFNMVDVTDPNNYWEGVAIKQH
jgi:hypothetical protein